MKNKLLLLSVQTLLVALPWATISLLNSEAHNRPPLIFAVPLLWAAAFAYLHYKKQLHTALNSYIAFLLMLWADTLTFPSGSGTAQFSYTAISLLCAAAIVLLRQTAGRKYPHTVSFCATIGTLALIAPPVFYIVFTLNFGATVTSEVFYAVFQSNLRESVEFIADWISPTSIIAATLSAVLIAFLSSQKQIGRFHISEALLLPCLIAAAFALEGHLRLYNFLFHAQQTYIQELDLFNSQQEKVKTGEIAFTAKKGNFAETYVVVIGEALNRDHMSLYGYVRDTTPRLEELAKSDLFITFSNAFSSHTHTTETLRRALTEINQTSHQDFFTSLSIVNILQKAGVDTYWITNQPLYSYHSNIVTIVAKQSEHLIPLNYFIGRGALTQSYDEVVLDEVKKVLAGEGQGTKAIFVHLMGSHNPYGDRYPQAHSAFSGHLSPGRFGNLHSQPISTVINWYDNGILYNDYVVSSIIELLEAAGGVSGFIYFADHADDVIGKKGHNSRNFTFSMTQIPLILWLSDQYRQTYPEKFHLLRKHSDELFTTDYIYDTLVGLIGIQTDRYQPKNDLTSSLYRLNEGAAYVLNGRLPYAHADNHRYHQRNNIRTLIDTGQGLRVVPHRVNSLGKLSQALFDGLEGFETDVFFRDSGTDGQSSLEVGHDGGSMSGLSLEVFLSKAAKVRKIWLDLKNLSAENHKKVLHRLDALDAQFDLKERLILETGLAGRPLADLSQAGWRTSYYLPTGKILQLLDANNSMEMQELAATISEQSRIQQLSAISFNAKLYPFVKLFLEPVLPPKLVYHIWGPAITLPDRNFSAVLQNQAFFHDKRVETILVGYQSPFHL